MNWFLRMIRTFEYESLSDLVKSLTPAYKYQLLSIVSITSLVSMTCEQLLGLNGLSLIAFIVIMLVEVISGINASRKLGQTFESKRFSRFLFKLFYYLAILFFVHTMGNQEAAKHNDIVAGIYKWLHSYLLIHIGAENIISILENKAVIDGKEKSAYIDGIKDFIKAKLS